MGALLLALIYVCFISLGLPDSLLGSAWPVLHAEIDVPVSFAGIISTVISLGTIVSSLLSDRMHKKMGAGMLTAVSISLTAIALFGFSISNHFWQLVLWAIPYGLGAGGVDAVLNNYVALHYKPQHMNWLHCFWGLGASVSPYIMSFALLRLHNWSAGYLIVSVVQILLSAIIFVSLPLWKKKMQEEEGERTQGEPLSLREIFKIPGAIACLILFFSYCALELSASLWVSSYLVEVRDVTPELASGFASLFYIGLTVGRALSGFLAIKLSDRMLIRSGSALIGVGIFLLFFPFSSLVSLVGFVMIGFGCAPVYPCMMHVTPELFGKERSQLMIGVQMASASSGMLLIPPLVGVIGDMWGMSLLPVCLAVLFAAMIAMHELLIVKTKK